MADTLRGDEGVHSGTRRGELVARRRKEPPDGVDVLVSYGLTQQGSIDFFKFLHLNEWWLNLLLRGVSRRRHA